MTNPVRHHTLTIIQARNKTKLTVFIFEAGLGFIVFVVHYVGKKHCATVKNGVDIVAQTITLTLEFVPAHLPVVIHEAVFPTKASFVVEGFDLLAGIGQADDVRGVFA